jgi:hypothetical protein
MRKSFAKYGVRVECGVKNEKAEVQTLVQFLQVLEGFFWL